VTALLKEATIIAVALLVSGAAVRMLGDRGALVPPPEMVVEEFVRDVSLKRWGPARSHLTETLARRLPPDSLRVFLDRLERRAGQVESVQGQPLFATDTVAEAAAEITTSGGGRAMLQLPLSREHGLWKVSRLDGSR
jgi:hypothetical protein